MYKEIDKLLEESLEKLTKASSRFSEIESSEIELPLQDIGKAIMSIWDLRDKIFAVHPELRPRHVLDHEAAEELFKTELGTATTLCQSGKPDEAMKILEALLNNPDAKALKGSITGRIANIRLNSKSNKKDSPNPPFVDSAV